MRARLGRALRGSDVAVGYAVVLLVTAVVVFGQPRADSDRIVLETSTNLANLSDRPLLVLFASAFVVSSPWGLWLLPFLLWAYGSAQRWLGRSATVLVAVVGHVFATVFVAVLLVSGIAHHQLDRSLAREPDVGVSYGLAAVAGVLLFRLPPGRRRRAGLLGTALLLVVLAVSETFTDLGHLTAWGTGLAMGLVGTRIAVAARADA